MKNYLHQLPRWLPAILMMLFIFSFSSIPGSEMPRFGWIDLLVKKGGHMIGYALLALGLLHWRRSLLEPGLPPFNILLLVWVLASVYSATDEFHQSFVPGRTANPIDILIDMFGAFLGLAAYNIYKHFVR